MFGAVDLETTGLDPAKNEIIHICVKYFDPDDFDVKYTFDSLIKPEYPDRFSEDSKKLNKKIIPFLDNAMSSTEVRSLFISWWKSFIRKPIVPIAQYFIFDSPFLMNWLGRDQYLSIFTRDYLDTKVISLFLKEIKKYPEDESTSLTSLSEFFFTPHDPHKAVSDCEQLIYVLREMKNLFK